MTRCQACMTEFVGVTSFDRHRTGLYGKTANTRRCMSHLEMRNAGMEVDEKGRWRLADKKELVSASEVAA